MDTIKKLLNDYGRPLAAKYLTRLILWGATAIFAKLSMETPDVTWATKTAEIAATALCAGAAMLIDYYHNKKDLATPPPKK
jgi:uncharacterized membrane protein